MWQRNWYVEQSKLNDTGWVIVSRHWTRTDARFARMMSDLPGLRIQYRENQL